MAPIITLLALAATTVFARPHSVSTGLDASARPTHSVASGKAYSEDLHSTKKPYFPDFISTKPALEIRDGDDCTTAVTVTTKVQVTVTITSNEVQETVAAEATPLSSVSFAQAEQVYTTSTIAPSSSARRHRHSTGTVSSGRPRGTLVPGSHASFSKPSGSVSLSRVSISLAAIETSSSSVLTILSGYVPSASSVATVDTSIQAVSLTSAVERFHAPSFTFPGIATSHIMATSSTSEPVVVPTTTTHVMIMSSTTTPVVVPTTTLKSSSTTQAAATSASSPSGKGKRGIAYNDASLTSDFASSSEISWAYNWASSTSGLASGLNYIPMLWGNGAVFTASWKSNAQKAIAAGSTHLFSFNEPDLAAQSNLTPDVAAASYKTYLHDMFAGGSTKLCAPAVTNGGGSMGLAWLKNFIAACPSCQIDCINLHWYGTSESDLEQHIADAKAIANGKEIWLTEFALTGTPSVADSQAFLTKAMTYLDGESAVIGYAYFMATQGILVSGTGLSSLGSTYTS